MDSRLPGGGAFAFAMTWRTLLAAGLALALLQVVSATHFYATALVLGGLIAFTIFDATRLYSRHDTALAQSVRSDHRDQARQLDRMAALLDAVTVALIAVGGDGRISYANRAARLLIGEEVASLAAIRALGPQAAAVIAALPAGARQIVTLADGRPMLVWVGTFAAPGSDAQRLISLQAVTGELDAVQVKAWADMTRVLSHEMMNSLTPIASLSESLPHLLRAGGDAADAVETIGRRSRHLMNFVERYRKIADLPAPSPRPFPLAQFLTDIDALMRAHLTARGIAYRSSHAPGAISLHADPDLLSQAILNLLHNAADAVAAMPAPAIVLTCDRIDGEILFTVSDNGPGIAADHLPEIFVPFFTTKPGGSGIGLTLARQIAMAHGGQIAVAANEAGGASFTLALPE